MKLNVILLSGGAGKRLWPLSAERCPKQFLKLFPDGRGGRESMLQRMHRQLLAAAPEAAVTVAAPADQAALIREQLGETVAICPEPCRRDTFPAIALAALHLKEVQGIAPEAPVVVCPVDPYVEEDYFLALKELAALAAEGTAKLTLMGMAPEGPSEKYGYILPLTRDRVSPVASFREKPDRETARDYIRRGGLWNGGVFAFWLEYLLEKARELTGFGTYEALAENYEALEKISFDYAVAEKERSIQVMKFAGKWQDIGTWSALAPVLEAVGETPKALLEDSENVSVVNGLDIPVICLGLKNALVCVGPEGILVADRDRADEIRGLVERL